MTLFLDATKNTFCVSYSNGKGYQLGHKEMLTYTNHRPQQPPFLSHHRPPTMFTAIKNFFCGCFFGHPAEEQQDPPPRLVNVRHSDISAALIRDPALMKQKQGWPSDLCGVSFVVEGNDIRSGFILTP